MIDGLWRLEGVFGWSGLERPEKPALWWFGDGVLVKPGPGLRRTGPEDRIEVEGTRSQGRLVIRSRLGRPSRFLYRLRNSELRLYGGGEAVETVRRGQTPSYLLKRVPGGSLEAPHARPGVIEDPVLGTLRQLRALPGCYSGTVVLDKHRISVDLMPRDRSNEELVHRARQVLSRLEGHVARATAFATKELLDLCGDWRQQAGERPVKASAFRRALALLGLSLDDESVTFEFDDGGMFRGHRIKAVMDASDRFVSVDI